MEKGFLPGINRCIDKDDKTLTCQDEFLQRWTQHFQELLYEIDQIETRQILDEENDDSPPTLTEIQI